MRTHLNTPTDMHGQRHNNYNQRSQRHDGVRFCDEHTATLQAMISTRQTSLKPLLEVGTSVYSAYWDPLRDPSRSASDPAWYPGVVSS